MRRTILSAMFGVGVLVLSLASPPVAAQPSGGPYGPIPTTYAVPKAAHVYYVAPDGKADATGTSLNEPTTIEAAISRVVTGDAIVMRGGTYRTGGLTLNQGITLQPYGDEQPDPQGHARGGEVGGAAQQHLAHQVGQALPGQARSAGGSATAKACGRRCTASTATWCSSTGELLQSVGWEGELDAQSFFVDYDAGLRLHRHRPGQASWSRSRRTTSPCCARRAAAARQGVRQEGPGDPRHHLHAVRLPGHRHRGQAAGRA